jgi:hypothetical protein
LKTIATVLFGVVMSGWSQMPGAHTLDPCSLLNTAELQQAFPGSSPGRNDHKLESRGILRCEWDHALILVLNADEGLEESPAEEASTWMQGFLDPLRFETVKRNVRFEPVTGVGDQAVAVVERQDQAKGVLRDAAVLVVRRGKRQVTIMAPTLARRERADALRVLGELGKAIARRLA